MSRLFRPLKRLVASPQGPLLVTGLTALFGAKIYYDGVESQRRNNSLMHALRLHLRSQPAVAALVGDGVELDPGTRVEGTHNHIKGVADLRFAILAANGVRADVAYRGRRRGDEWYTDEFAVSRDATRLDLRDDAPSSSEPSADARRRRDLSPAAA
ncbi:hypothetical protein CXG81DRAFT_19074 [Caulochytrium protostelioides]|uniref:DUF1783-domain-containing protein n=1 Tax=Caulochytrium protostelioides TaxID=1555241 RepID=A0A4P9X7Q0_9FUNG|nr:hypothetical protein CXG81DRAFT_19074 [Caulochytrium protostelioides]|eukprot:RKP01080.1 hypothetical protein CXG81DRAFT_19074 [Caulochytrium protostelioides]